MDSLTNDFDEYVHEIFGSNIKYSIYCPPTSKPVFDYFLDVTTGNFVEWNMLLPSMDSLIRKTKSDEITETIDSVRYTFLATLLLMSRKSILITGSSGIGKTVQIKSMLKRLTQFGININQIKKYLINLN
jgi:dynein heavy chain